MIKLLNYWCKINQDLFVIKADGLEDFRAVVGAKTSRASDLNIKSQIDTEGVSNFLSMNLAGYGHASIGEMSFPTVYHKGFGWVGAWLIEDDPLFIGQEVSTRAVNLTKNNDSNLICYDAPIFLQEAHNFFIELFKKINVSNVEKTGYKYDRTRWALPGTLRLGVSSMMNSRIAVRHLERIQSIPFVKDIANNFMLGIEKCSPYVFNALKKNNRSPYNRWTNLDILELKNDINIENSISVEPLFDVEERLKNIRIINSRKEKDYLDSEFKVLTPFRVNITCTIASARDWHRHRSVMPWIIRLVEDSEGNPVIAPWVIEDISEEHIKDTNEIIRKNYTICKEKTSKDNSMQIFYSLPYGALVNTECNGSLPDILYMFELRGSASGSNFEYKAHAKQGLKILSKILNTTFVNNQKIDRTLNND